MSDLKNVILEEIYLAVKSSPVFPFVKRKKRIKSFSLLKVLREEFRDTFNIRSAFNDIDSYELFNEDELKIFDNRIREIKLNNPNDFQSSIEIIKTSTNNFLIGRKDRYEILEPSIPLSAAVIGSLVSFIFLIMQNKLIAASSSSAIIIMSLMFVFFIKSSIVFSLKVANLRRVLLERIDTL
jgi:hypothetical protein